MDIGSILVILAIVIIVAGFIARPILEKRGVSMTETSRLLSELQAERDQILLVLQELDMDHAMGKVPTEDYEDQRPGLVTRGADVLKKLDQLGGLHSDPVKSKDQEDRDLDAMIEGEILRRRKTSSGGTEGFCTQCGNLLQAGDHFCTSCGAQLEVGEKEA
jgi:hypothetical protein